VVPTVQDFGTVPAECNSPTRDVLIYNQCAEPVVIDSVVIGSAAGEGPGGPNCPGSEPCPEFLLVSGVSAPTSIPPGSPPLRFSVKYRPINYGPDTGAAVITTGDGVEFVVALQGRGDMHARNTDTFRQESTSFTSFYLTGLPMGVIEVRVDGVLSPSTNWSYDAVSNAVNFVPAFVPPPGSTTTITYDSASCLP
jgi:hypothetical protein